MDNMSSVGGEDLSRPSERLEQDFGPSEFEQRAEQRQFGGQAELGRGALEAMPQMALPEAQAETETNAAQLGYGDANAQMTEVDGRVLGTDLVREVKQNNEHLTKDTVKAVDEIAQKFNSNPHDGLIDFGLARKAYMKKAFNRSIGERNDGSVDTKLNVTGNQKQGKVA